MLEDKVDIESLIVSAVFVVWLSIILCLLLHR